MPLDSRSVSSPAQHIGSLQGCLVEGDPEQRCRERGVRRKALATSVFLQTSVLAALVLIPLLGRPAPLARTIMTPVPPYRHPAARPQAAPAPRGDVRPVCIVCVTSRPANLTPTRGANTNEPIGIQELGSGEIPAAPCPSCIDIGQTNGPRPPVANEPRRGKPPVVHTQIDPAMLIHRVEPTYPILPKQLGRSGRVELRAIIATDGTIQSLRVVSGDPLFYQSALDAVSQWRYRPTVLNGEPVEIDTFITVIYNIDRR